MRHMENKIKMSKMDIMKKPRQKKNKTVGALS